MSFNSRNKCHELDLIFSFPLQNLSRNVNDGREEGVVLFIIFRQFLNDVNLSDFSEILTNSFHNVSCTSNDLVCLIPNYNQQDTTFLDLFISTDALHISGGSSAHHQEHKTVHTVSGIVNQYCCWLQ